MEWMLQHIADISLKRTTRTVGGSPMRLIAQIKARLRRRKYQRESVAQGLNVDSVAPKRGYPGSHRRHYRVYIPPGYRAGTAVPLVMVLHGCHQDHRDIQAISRFDTVADRHNFIVVYPFVTNYFDIRSRNCWGWWLHKHTLPGHGEVQDLWQIVEDVVAEYSIDPQRIHIAGLSSGAGMAVAALTVHANRFASGASVAGVAYGELPRAVVPPLFSDKRQYTPIGETLRLMRKVRSDERTSTPLFIVQSHGDSRVLMQSAINLRDVWLRYFGEGKTLITRTQNSATLGTAWVHTRYTKLLGDSEVETLFLDGLEHGWYGGAPGDYSYPAAPPLADMMWNFFRRHPRQVVED